jgi:integrase
VKKPKQVITAAQFEKILAEIPVRYRMLVFLEIETGMRWGELIARRPCDIDFKTRTVTPHDRRSREEELPHRAAAVRQGLPERRRAAPYSNRQGHLPAATRAHGRVRRPRRRPAIHVNCRDGVVAEQFPHQVLGPGRQGRKVTFHNLRAAHASWLLAGGADIIVVQERLGHRRIETTQQYTGTLPDAGERALAAFRKISYAERTGG